jgi:photosystem II stability/assembly factor-like uncharacterized protein
MNPTRPALTAKYLLSLTAAALLFASTLSAQMREIYLNTDTTTNDLCKLSFYSPSQGFVAFSSWIGFTTDSGRTFAQKTITLSNVNYNGYPANLTFGFGIMGIKAFDQNTLIVYGDYGAIPSILYSTDGGNTFTLVFNSQMDPNSISLTNGVAAMDFASTTTTGFAVDEDRILKSNDKGLTWSVVYTSTKSYYNYVQALDVNNVFAGATYNNAASKLQKTTDGGVTWQTVTLPAPTTTAKLTAAFFLNPTTGWIVMQDNGPAWFYSTTNGGNTWNLLNNVQANSFPAATMKFVDANVGYAVDGQNTVYKTSSGGAVWEPLPRDNNLTYPYLSTNDIQLMGTSQVWAGFARLKMLELSTNAGGIPLPRAYLFVDTTGLAATSSVKLTNYSATTYTYQWLLNGVLISTAYNSSYVHDLNRLRDTVTLIVSNGTYSDTATSYANFSPPIPPPTITSFTPASGATGTEITIAGTNLSPNGMTPTVTIGGVPVAWIDVASSTLIYVEVGAGASGNIVVTTWGGSASAGPFTYIPPPVIDSFSPATATLGDTVTIYGHNFTGVTAVTFGDSTASSFTVVSDSIITATVWLGASGTIQVTRPSGTGQDSGFHFIPPPPPVINNLSTFSGTAGTPVKIFGTHFYGTISVTFGGTDANSFTVVSDSEIDAIVGLSVSGDVVVMTVFGSGSIGGFIVPVAPTISTFFPVSGSIGTVVTISGTNFSPVAAQNIVYFGAVRGIVTTASPTQLTVPVPYGASYQPISVTVNNNLTAWSLSPFMVTSLNAISTLTDSSFNEIKEFPSGGYQSGNMVVADFDGDGKPDLANNLGYTSNVSVIRNLCTPGNISFDTLINLPTGSFPAHVVASDVDGDGKLDLIGAGNDISVFKNTSSGIGHISFANAVTIKVGNGIAGVVMGDLNGDGKPDMVIIWNNSVEVYGNISTPDSIAFAAPITYTFQGDGLSGGVAIGDMDGDGKPDLVVVEALNSVDVLRNTGSVGGSLSFAPFIRYSVGTQYWALTSLSSVAIGDLDGDGKPDLAVGLAGDDAFAVLRNKSTIGSVAFDPDVDFTTADNFTKSVAIEDMDGDGKADVTIENASQDLVSVYKNTSTPGHIGFNSPLQYVTGSYPTSVSTGDLDLDGKPDIVTNSNAYPGIICVLRDKAVAGTLPVIADTNFKIQAVNIECRGKNDGKIIVTVSQELGYQVILSDSAFVDTVQLTGKSYEWDNLPPTVYKLCFTTDSVPGYQQCFTVSITQPEDLSVLSVVAPTDTSVTVTLGGSAVYYIDFNGATFQTSDPNITLPLQPGANSLSVQTSLTCQGMITRTFYRVASDIKLIPNPVINTASIYLPGTDAEVQIEVLSVDGTVVERACTYTVGADRSVKLNMTGYASGLYVVHVQGTTLNSSIKVIKTY